MIRDGRPIDPRAWGIDPGYHDIAGTWREPPAACIDALLRAMGADGDAPPTVPDLWIVGDDRPVQLDGRWELHAEDGTVRPVEGALPHPPLGYHWLRNDAGREVRLIVSPRRCFLPPGLRKWGWALQLYALRSGSSWGIGDLGDLRRFARASAAHGAGMLLLNPLHAPTPVEPVQPSPYYPSSRCFRNPLYLRVEDVPGAEVLGERRASFAKAGQALNRERLIPHDGALRLKLEALGEIWKRAGAGERFDAYRAERGEILARFATYCALAEVHGASWHTWPAELRDPASPAVAAFADAHRDRVGFHAWLQWLIDLQLAAAGAEIDLMQDLAIGVDPGGADAWMWQDVIVQGVAVGAPPDEFNTRGQDWGLPPFDPWRLRRAHFAPFIETVRAGLRHAGGLRFDHVMGLFRLYWIPPGATPAEGAYVRYPWQELLDILALESHRAGAYVVGEDLGTVEPWVREELARRDVLSYRLFLFEPGPPRDYPERALAAVTTHDLPTLAGLWTGADLRAQVNRGMRPNVEGTLQIRERIRDWTGLPDDAPPERVVEAVYRLLAEAPSALLTATLEDALSVEERPNYPGTVGGTNWSLALPAPLEAIESDPRLLRLARLLGAR